MAGYYDPWGFQQPHYYGGYRRPLIPTDPNVSIFVDGMYASGVHLTAIPVHSRMQFEKLISLRRLRRCHLM